MRYCVSKVKRERAYGSLADLLVGQPPFHWIWSGFIEIQPNSVTNSAFYGHYLWASWPSNSISLPQKRLTYLALWRIVIDFEVFFLQDEERQRKFTYKTYQKLILRINSLNSHTHTSFWTLSIIWGTLNLESQIALHLSALRSFSFAYQVELQNEHLPSSIVSPPR